MQAQTIHEAPSMRPSSSLLGAIVALALASAIVFVGVALHEIAYASDHPYQYGPAHVIAWGAGAGALLSASLCLLAFALMRSSEQR
jgi:hypothetical protein